MEEITIANILAKIKIPQEIMENLDERPNLKQFVVLLRKGSVIPELATKER